MHPSQVFALFPPFPRENTVFVAMSFDDRFTHRWKAVIEPAIGAVTINGERLRAVRVDTRDISDSILTEILRGISSAQAVFADVTSIGRHDDYVIRNGNVMYEVGLAHAVRLPAEVLLFRSDQEQLLFDIAGIRVVSYSPDNQLEAARVKVRAAIANALREVDLQRNMAVEAAVRALGYDGFIVISHAGGDGLRHPVSQTVGDALRLTPQRLAIARALDAGLIAMKAPKLTPDRIRDLPDETNFESLFEYHLTPFGHEVLVGIGKQFGWTPEQAAEWGALADELDPSG